MNDEVDFQRMLDRAAARRIQRVNRIKLARLQKLRDELVEENEAVSAAMSLYEDGTYEYISLYLAFQNLELQIQNINREINSLLE